jgi:tetratricopeptide (TPR) repeat protein
MPIRARALNAPSSCQRVMRSLVVVSCVLLLCQKANGNPPVADDCPPWKAKADYFRARVNRSIAENNLRFALEQQVDLVAAFSDQNDPVAQSQQAEARAELDELQRVARLPEAKQKQFLVARQKVKDAFSKPTAASSVQTLKEALDSLREVVGETSTSTADACTKICIVCINLQEYVQARTYMERAMAIRKSLLGTKNGAYLDSAMATGLAYSNTGDDARGESIMREAVAEIGRQFGEGNLKHAEGLLMLWAPMSRQKKWSEAESLCRRCISIASANSPRTVNSIQIHADALSSLALAQAAQEDFANAERSIRASAKIWEEIPRANRAEQMRVLEIHAFALRKPNRDDDTKQVEDKIIALRPTDNPYHQ